MLQALKNNFLLGGYNVQTTGIQNSCMMLHTKYNYKYITQAASNKDRHITRKNICFN